MLCTVHSISNKLRDDGTSAGGASDEIAVCTDSNMSFIHINFRLVSIVAALFEGRGALSRFRGICLAVCSRLARLCGLASGRSLHLFLLLHALHERVVL